MNNSDNSIWLIGAGGMSQEYAKVLRGLNKDFIVIGRGEDSAKKFEENTNCHVIRGGVDTALEKYPLPSSAIVSVGVADLAITSSKLIKAGVKRILIEKPGALNSEELKQIQLESKKSQTEIFIAYNRRFYSSTSTMKKLIEEDGGVLSCTFEFTEWSHLMSTSSHTANILNTWFFANSTHVVDLVFHICGTPKDWKSWTSGKLDWHPNSARFVGSGITEKNILFSYLADWEAPGRWSIEFLTKKRRYILKPMEELQVIELGSVVVNKYNLDNSIDIEYKAGLYNLTSSFLNNQTTCLCTLEEQIKNVEFYNKIAGYN